MSVKNILGKLVYWFIPPGIKNLVYKINQQIRTDKAALKLCAANIKFRNIHSGRRCFIVCSGPSINKQNLLPLKDEVVFSVSRGYLYKDYAIIQPRYHCQPGIEYTKELTKDFYINWFREMNYKIGRAELFLNAKDEPFIRQNNLFPNRGVNYLYFDLDWDESQREIIDITKKIPVAQSVPIMCLVIAMYMGFEEIYLLGAEHDSFITGQYQHFYTHLPDYDNRTGPNIIKNGKIVSLYEELKTALRLWRQYRIIKNIAYANHIKIYNATAGGVLDEFERVPLESLFPQK